ncbi:histone-lysine N-methyltransferase SETMAR-like [Argiope bruennichi]|uniref:histone-lysine N-methyltransferase SETMAR-like n=1 Tax=Argiope bruennichi TaxID=94029 RepID=UPI002494DA6E|nr:histone-lysine N-methyltransferase SETMAR-like [Argiope bruennichi]
MNAELYCETLRGLSKLVKNKRYGKLSKGVVLLHDKASTTQCLFRSFEWEVWQQPPFNPDMTPSDFNVFGKLKNHLGGSLFSNEDQIQTAFLSWLQDQRAIFYSQGIERLVLSSDKCLQRLGDYVEK